MYKLCNDSVLFKEGEMPYFIHYGMLYIAQETEKTDTVITFEILKFNLETGKYEHTNEKTEFEIDGKIVPVVDGFATVEYTPEPMLEPTLSEVEQAILQSVINSEYLIALQENKL